MKTKKNFNDNSKKNSNGIIKNAKKYLVSHCSKEFSGFFILSSHKG